MWQPHSGVIASAARQSHMEKISLPGFMRFLRFARNRLVNLLLVAENDEITTLSTIARDDVASHSGRDEECKTHVCGTPLSMKPLKN